MQESSSTKRVLWAIWAAVLAVALVAVCYQIYRVSVGEVASYGYTPRGEKPAGPPQVREHDLDEDLVKSGIKLAATDEVKQLAQYHWIKPSELNVGEFKGSDKQVDFRNQSGSIVCTIRTQIETLKPGGFVEQFNHPGMAKPSGEGVICSVVRARVLNAEDAAGKCEAGRVTGSAFAAWGTDPQVQVGAGTCLQGWSRLAQHSIDNKSIANVYPALALRQRVRVGQWACADEGAQMICVNLADGKGFKIGAETYELIK